MARGAVWVLLAASAAVGGGCNSDCETQGSFVRRPLSSLCGGGSTADCPASPADLIVRCSDSTSQQPLVRAEGCGLARYEISSTSYTFDAQSGQLVGVYQWSDLPWGECDTFGYLYGMNLLIGIPGGCPEAGTSFCTACGSTSSYPACP